MGFIPFDLESDAHLALQQLIMNVRPQASPALLWNCSRGTRFSDSSRILAAWPVDVYIQRLQAPNEACRPRVAHGRAWRQQEASRKKAEHSLGTQP
jgi:hypothetical protein